MRSHARTCSRRAAAVVGAAAACFLAGCATTGPRVATGPIPETAPELSLDNAQLTRATALAHFATGLALEANQQSEAALEEYLKSLALEPDNVQLTLQVSKIYFERRDPENALALLQKAVEANPGSADAHYAVGLAYRQLDQPEKAAEAAQEALARDPGHLNALRLLLEMLTQRAVPGDLTGVVHAALQQKRNEPGYWMTLGDLLTAALRLKPMLAAQVDRAGIRQCYEKAAALAPNNLDIQARMAEVYTEAGDYSRAADAYSKLLEARPENDQILDRLWRMYVRSDQKDKAIATLEELARRDPASRFEIYNTLGDLYEESDKTDAAIANYQQSLVLNPNQLELYVRIALAQMRQKRLADAGMTLLAAKEKFPTKYQVPYLLGLLHIEHKNYTNAVASFADAEALAKLDPEEIKPSSAFYFAYGSASERAGDIERAATLFRKAIELDPANHNAYNYLGYMWADKGIHLDESLELIQRALELDPDNGAYLDSLGWVLFRLGRYEEALPPLRRAVEILEKTEHNEDAVVFDHLAEVLLKLGKLDEAIEAWRRALKLDPGNKEVGEKLQKYSPNHSSNH